MDLGEPRQRWTDSFHGDELGVFRAKERDCDGCGNSGTEVRVLRGWRRDRDVHRRLGCPCGRTWWQVSVG